MCLILIAIRPDEDHQLVIAANRDEQYARPAEQADWWSDYPHVLGGRDRQAGGTWLGVTSAGRFAAVTNFREDPPDPLPPRSRGELTANFLKHNEPAEAYLRRIHESANLYRGFNLIVGDEEGYFYYSNREGEIRELRAGFYGLSNQLLDCDWAKVVRGRRQLSRLDASGFPQQKLFDILFCKGDGTPFSQSFIATESYGTSASTVLKINTHGRVYFEERNFGPRGEGGAIRQFEFTLAATHRR